MKDVFELEKLTDIKTDNSYIISYPHILSYASDITTFSESDVVRLSHMVYGWMPTVLDLYFPENGISLTEAAQLLQKAREKGNLTESDFSELKALVNNSMVGVSKLLHFIAPEHYAIWDSKIYTFCHGQHAYDYRVNNVTQYMAYQDQMRLLLDDSRLPAFHRSVNNKLGYPVSALRALEIIMFLNA